jgi:CubicO group peptidase (beta-lactamase class C family)
MGSKEEVNQGHLQAGRINTDAICAAFEENFASRSELGASLSVWSQGREVLSLHAGRMTRESDAPAWTAHTLVPFWSATKGIAAACCLRALETGGWTLENRVADLWPEFAGGGKQDITIGQVLSHSAGLSSLDEQVDVLDYPAVIAALERQKPTWRPGKSHGYHPRTFGFLADELVRRATGADSLSAYFHGEIAIPLKLDLWIGLPASQFHRVATLYPGRLDPALRDEPFCRAFNTPGSETRRAFDSPRGLHAVGDMNTPAGWTAGLAAMGGVGSAHALGRFYACLAAGGEGLFSAKVISALQTTRTCGHDRTLCTPTAFSAGMMLDVPETRQPLFGLSGSAFGHPGAGGSHAFADSENHIAFAYVMNQMEFGALPKHRALKLVEALYFPESPAP